MNLSKDDLFRLALEVVDTAERIENETGQQIDMLDLLGMKVSFAGELYAYGTDCRKGTCE